MVERVGLSYRLLIIAEDDPFPTSCWMRDEDLAHYSAAEDVWVLTRYADCSAAFRDWQTWSSQRRGNLLNDIPERVGKSLGTTDPPRHTFARSIVNKAFTPRTVVNLEPTIRTQAREVCAQARERGTCEVVNDISAPFIVTITSDSIQRPGPAVVRLGIGAGGGQRWEAKNALDRKPRASAGVQGKPPGLLP